MRKGLGFILLGKGITGGHKNGNIYIQINASLCMTLIAAGDGEKPEGVQERSAINVVKKGNMNDS